MQKTQLNRPSVYGSAVFNRVNWEELEPCKQPKITRFQWKVNLVKMLFHKGYSKQDVYELFRFIDWLLMLPKALEKDFKNKIAEIEEEYKMSYVTNIERLGREEGIQEGEILEKQNVLRKQLDKKFGLTEKENQIISNQPNPELLDKALDEFVFANCKEEVLKHLQ